MARVTRVIGDSGLRVPAPLAALWNGLAGHAMDWDDTQLADGPNRPSGLLTHPAMAAGVSDRLWEIGDIVKLVEDAEPKPSKRGSYKNRDPK